MAGKRRLPQQPTQFTKGDWDHAAESVREMVAGDKILQSLMSLLITAERIYMVGLSALRNEIEHEWDVDDPELIIQVIVKSCKGKANEKFEILALQQGILQEVVPVIDIFVQQARETGRNIGEDSTDEETNGTRPNEECDVPGSDQGDETGRGGSPAGAEARSTVEGGHLATEAPREDRQDAGASDALADDGLRAEADVD